MTSRNKRRERLSPAERLRPSYRNAMLADVAELARLCRKGDVWPCERFLELRFPQRWGDSVKRLRRRIEKPERRPGIKPTPCP